MKSPAFIRAKLREYRKSPKKRRNLNIRIMRLAPDPVTGLDQARAMRVTTSRTRPCKLVKIAGKRDDYEIIPSQGIYIGTHAPDGVSREDVPRFVTDIERPKIVNSHKISDLNRAGTLPFRHLRRCPKCDGPMRLYPVIWIHAGDKVAPQIARILRANKATQGVVQTETCTRARCFTERTHFLSIADVKRHFRASKIGTLTYGRIAGRSVAEIRASAIRK